MASDYHLDDDENTAALALVRAWGRDADADPPRVLYRRAPLDSLMGNPDKRLAVLAVAGYMPGDVEPHHWLPLTARFLAVQALTGRGHDVLHVAYRAPRTGRMRRSGAVSPCTILGELCRFDADNHHDVEVDGEGRMKLT